MPGGIGLGGPLPPGAPEPRAVFYAVAAGRKTGVFHTWAAAENSVRGYSGALFKKFYTLKDAENYLASEAGGRPPSASNGVRNSWAEAKASVEGFSGAKQKSFAAAAADGGANVNEECLKGPFYAVAVGRQAGIFNNWPTAHASVNGFPGALHQRFHTRAQATAFLEAHAAACARSGTARRQQRKPATVALMVMVVLVVAAVAAVVIPW